MMSGPWQITAGRQRVAWGTNLVWNLIDLFNPYNILDFDYEERPGVDAVHIQYYTSPVTKIEGVVKPGVTDRTTTYAAKLTAHAGTFDLHLMAAENDARWIGGLAWAGDLWGAGFRGEATVTGMNDDIALHAGLDPSTPRTVAAAAVSADYTFSSSLYLHTEAMYNQLGLTRNAETFRLQSVALNMRSPARWSTYWEIAEDVSPLVRASIFAIVNPSDGSFVLAPTLTCSVATNLDATFLALAFHGDTGTEFGGEGTTAFARLKWSW